MTEYKHPFLSPNIPASINQTWQQRRLVCDAIKKLSEQLVAKDLPLERLQALASLLNDEINLNQPYDNCGGRVNWLKTGNAGEMGELVHEISCLIGRSNPVAPPITIWMDGDVARATVTLSWNYEGPPNCVHGGFVAAIFDEFLGDAQMLVKRMGATGNLTIRYHRPTPLHKELKLEARVKSVSERKAVLLGEMYDGDTLTASAEGVFIAVDWNEFV